MKSYEEIKVILAEAFIKESRRLNSWGTKTDEKSAVSFAVAVARPVQALMGYSRSRELKRILKLIEKEKLVFNNDGVGIILTLVQERYRITKIMARLLEKTAAREAAEKPWKHKHKKDKKTKKHRKHRSGSH